MAAIFNNDWQNYLKDEFAKDYYTSLRKFLITEYKNYKIFPDMYEIFNCLNYTSFSETKVVIIGQDPYHEEGQAHGLSFSVKPGISIPPSLYNIYKELNSDLGCFIPNNGCLIPWAKQGVLLLNAVLTVRAHNAASHKDKGWEKFTDNIINLLNLSDKNIVFILWGSFAQSKSTLITNPRHLIIKSPHPSPLSSHRGFFGSKPFSKTNEFLLKNGYTPINWQIPNL
ncbi:MAG: uracil-DNA glycosylase [Eubacteriaceae bacterium]